MNITTIIITTVITSVITNIVSQIIKFDNIKSIFRFIKFIPKALKSKLPFKYRKKFMKRNKEGLIMLETDQDFLDFLRGK